MDWNVETISYFFVPGDVAIITGTCWSSCEAVVAAVGDRGERNLQLLAVRHGMCTC